MAAAAAFTDVQDAVRQAAQVAAASSGSAAGGKRRRKEMAPEKRLERFFDKLLIPYTMNVKAQLGTLGIDQSQYDMWMQLLDSLTATHDTRHVFIQNWDAGMSMNVLVREENDSLYAFISEANDALEEFKRTFPEDSGEEDSADRQAALQDTSSVCLDVLDAVLSTGHPLVEMLNMQEIRNHANFSSAHARFHIKWWHSMNNKVKEYLTSAMPGGNAVLNALTAAMPPSAPADTVGMAQGIHNILGMNPEMMKMGMSVMQSFMQDEASKRLIVDLTAGMAGGDAGSRKQIEEALSHVGTMPPEQLMQTVQQGMQATLREAGSEGAGGGGSGTTTAS